jgi:hypothetical protein
MTAAIILVCEGKQTLTLLALGASNVKFTKKNKPSGYASSILDLQGPSGRQIHCPNLFYSTFPLFFQIKEKQKAIIYGNLFAHLSELKNLN